jgi:hypothetical protein
MEDVEKFVEEKELLEIKAELERAAYLAKDPNLYEQVARGNINGEGLPVTLTPKEKVAIVNEKDALFKQSKDLYITIITCSAAALLQYVLNFPALHPPSFWFLTHKALSSSSPSDIFFLLGGCLFLHIHCLELLSGLRAFSLFGLSYRIPIRKFCSGFTSFLFVKFH